MTNVHTANAQHGLLPLQPIARIAMPTREAFFEDYVWPCRPVVLTDLAHQWGDLSRWEPRALAARVHDVRLPVSITRGIYDFARGDDNWVSRDTVTAMSVAELVARMEEGRDECLYLNQQSIPERFPELVPELREPSVMPPGSVQKLYLWVGSKGNVLVAAFRPAQQLPRATARPQAARAVRAAGLRAAVSVGDDLALQPCRHRKPDLAQFPDYSGAQGYEVDARSRRHALPAAVLVASGLFGFHERVDQRVLARVQSSTARAGRANESRGAVSAARDALPQLSAGPSADADRFRASRADGRPTSPRPRRRPARRSKPVCVKRR